MTHPLHQPPARRRWVRRPRSLELDWLRPLACVFAIERRQRRLSDRIGNVRVGRNLLSRFGGGAGFACGECIFGRNGRRCGHRLRRLDRLRPPLQPIAERAQNGGEILAGGAGERGHGVDHGEAAAADGARRLRPRRAFAPGERRADQISKPLEDIDTNRPLAAHPITGGAIKHGVDVLIHRDRGAAAAGKVQQVVEPLALRLPHAPAPRAGRQAHAAPA